MNCSGMEGDIKWLAKQRATGGWSGPQGRLSSWTPGCHLSLSLYHLGTVSSKKERKGCKYFQECGTHNY